MNDFLVNMAINVILTVIKLAVKNHEVKEDVKNAMLKIKSQIELLYPEEN